MVVRDGQTLSQIASTVGQRGYTLDQTMLALLRANPDAFIKGNVNLLKSGAVLRVPPAQDAAELAPREAAAVVRDHLEQWRALSAPAPQPASVASDAAASPSNTAKDAAAASTASKTGARVAGARLEIVPPSDRAANNPGSRSGASAGGEGDMLRQQELQQTKEDLAARNAEVEDLKSRVAELEKLQKDQAALIAMKDSKLAAAEQRLAQSNDAQAATTQTATTQATPPQQQASTPTWLWGGAGLLVIGVVAWLFTRRRKVAPSPRRAYDTEAMAAGLPIVDDVADDAARDEPAPLFAEQDTKPAAPHWTSAPAKFGSAPTWHAGGNAPGVDTAVAEPQTATQQIDLARAYLDMGDDDAARVILREVLATSRDPMARDTAARMLREL
jgi:pilus assembly protein FimV